MSGFGDPFDVAGADIPAANGGISPSFWHNLMMFGGNMAAAANARTPQGFLQFGNGFAGPFGAALSQTAQSSLDTARARSQMGLAGQQAQKIGLENQLTRMQMPYQIAQSQLQYRFMTDPEFARQYMQQFTGVPDMPQDMSQAQPQQQPDSGGTPFAANNPLNMRFAGQDGATDTKGFAAFQTPEAGQAATTKQFGLYADRGINTLRGLISTWAPPSENDTNGYIANIAQATGINPDDQIDLKNPQIANTIQTAMAKVEGNKNGRVQLAQAGNGPAPMQGQSQQQPQQSGGGQVNQQAMMQAQRYEQQANQIDMLRQLHIPVPGDPAALRQAAQQWRDLALAGPKAASIKAAELPFAGPNAAAVKAAELPFAGPEQAAKSANSNVDLRPGGMARVVNPDGSVSWIKNPQLEKVQGPNGTEYYTHITPPLPDAPPGTAGESSPVMDTGTGQPAVAKIPENLQKARDKAYEDFTGKDTDSYLAAQNTQAWLEQMSHAADEMNKNGGFLQTGPTSPSRLKFASTINDILRTSGLPIAFDPDKISSWEEYKKATTTAGFELSSHYEGHARQAAQTIENATAAVPSPANSPQGAMLVSAGIREAAQSAIDLHQYKQNVYNSQGDLGRAEVDFYKQTPAQMYARRAISTQKPYDINEDSQLSRYLPGTFVKYKGHVVQVPEREGAPPIPEYLKNMQVPNGG